MFGDRTSGVDVWAEAAGCFTPVAGGRAAVPEDRAVLAWDVEAADLYRDTAPVDEHRAVDRGVGYNDRGACAGGGGAGDAADVSQVDGARAGDGNFELKRPTHISNCKT